MTGHHKVLERQEGLTTEHTNHTEEGGQGI